MNRRQIAVDDIPWKKAEPKTGDSATGISRRPTRKVAREGGTITKGNNIAESTSQSRAKRRRVDSSPTPSPAKGKTLASIKIEASPHAVDLSRVTIGEDTEIASLIPSASGVVSLSFSILQLLLILFLEVRVLRCSREERLRRCLESS